MRSFRFSCAPENNNEVVDRHVYDPLQSDTMLVGSFFEISHVFKAPFRNLGGENFAIEGLVGRCRLFSIDFKWSIDSNKAVFGQNPGRHLCESVGDSDRRDLE